MSTTWFHKQKIKLRKGKDYALTTNWSSRARKLVDTSMQFSSIDYEFSCLSQIITHQYLLQIKYQNFCGIAIINQLHCKNKEKHTTRRLVFFIDFNKLFLPAPTKCSTKCMWERVPWKAPGGFPQHPVSMNLAKFPRGFAWSIRYLTKIFISIIKNSYLWMLYIFKSINKDKVLILVWGFFNMYQVSCVD